MSSGAPSLTSHPTPAQVLRAAAKMIEAPGQWTQGAFARTKAGKSVTWNDEKARCWCASGAIFRAAEPFSYIGDKAWTEANAHIPRRYAHLAVFNDDRQQAEVVQFLRKVAERLDPANPETARELNPPHPPKGEA